MTIDNNQTKKQNPKTRCVHTIKVTFCLVTPCLRPSLVCISVVQFFLVERTSGPILTFKNLYDDSLGTGLSQVLPKFEPFDSGSIKYFQIQELPNPVFESGLVSCTHYTFPNATKFYDKLK